MGRRGNDGRRETTTRFAGDAVTHPLDLLAELYWQSSSVRSNLIVIAAARLTNALQRMNQSLLIVVGRILRE